MLKKITIIAPLSLLVLSLSACSHKPISPAKQTSAQPSLQKKVANKKTAINQPQARKRYAVKTAIFKSKRSRRAHRRHYNKNKRHTRSRNSSPFLNKLSNAALGRLRHRVRYDGSYVKIRYPWGDVPANMGVCTDVVIRSYRKLGIDLQQQVHNDMSAAFRSYPNVPKWGLSKPDSNIDHRRVYNLRAFFKRQGAALPVTRNPRDYKPGDLVTWMVGPNLPHIGMVVNKRSKADPNRYMIVHNIARGPEMEDILFRFPVTGHYRYTPAHMNRIPKVRNQMIASNSPRSNRRTNYTQLVNDAARVMQLHGNKAPQSPNKRTQEQQLVTIGKTINVLKSKKPKSITLAQAKLVDLSTAQLSNLLKK